MEAFLKSPQALGSFYARNTGRITAVVTAVLVVVLARLAAEAVWALVPMPQAARWQPPPAPPPAMATRPPDANSIAAASLFGHYQPAANPGAAALNNAPDTQLALTLLGIYAGSARDSRALIATQNGDEEPYAIGDTVTPGVTLQAIFADRVVLSRNGRLETLRLDKDKQNAAGDGVALGPPPSDEDSEQLSGLARIRNEILMDPGKAQDYIRVQPVSNGGTVKGYRVFPGKNRDLFTDAGLRPGDLVTSINGVELSDTAKSMQLLADLAEVDDLTVVVDRGGQSQTIRVSLAPE